MPYNYDKLYSETPNALGEPTPIIVDFFNRHVRQNARILDVGCGQGRDALFLARSGHNVVGVDHSPHGIRDLQAAAGKEKLPVEGLVADITSFEPSGKFDVILIDRTLHMLNVDARLSALSMLLDHVTDKGWLLIADEPSNIAEFEQVISGHHLEWDEGYKKRGYLFVHRN